MMALLVGKGSESIALGHKHLGTGHGIVLGVNPTGYLEVGTKAIDSLLSPIGDVPIFLGMQDIVEQGLCRSVSAALFAKVGAAHQQCPSLLGIVVQDGIHRWGDSKVVGVWHERIVGVALQAHEDIHHIEAVRLHGALLEGLARTGDKAIACTLYRCAMHRGIVHRVACHVGALELCAAGTYTLNFTKKDDFFTVKVEAPGYVTKTLRVYNQDTRNIVPIDLREDESIGASVGSVLANKYFTINVREGVDEDQAWKLLAQVLLNYFEELKTSDKSSGFMTTPWYRLSKLPMKGLHIKYVFRQK